MQNDLDATDKPLLSLGRLLRERGYRFITTTPLSHARVVNRDVVDHIGLRDIFGWNRPFAREDLPPEMFECLKASETLLPGQNLRSAIRYSSLGTQLFLHSGYPTVQEDAVFFGPDTYRFANAIGAVLPGLPPTKPMRVLDIGAGSGAGGLCAAQLLKGRVAELILTDINARALRYSRINALLNGVANTRVVYSDLYKKVTGPFDLILSNPPYLVDGLQRTYRHGGGAFGSGLSLRIAEEGWRHLSPGGRLLLYTGSAIVDGEDLFERDLRARLPAAVELAYSEIDPDVFGEELDDPPYDRADRIAAVAAVLTRI